MKNTTVYIFIGVVLLAITLGALLFEFKDVPDVSWRQNYLPESKEPYGTWMFKALLEERYGADNILDRYSEIETNEIDSTEKHLLVMIGPDLNLDFKETDALANFSNDGNDILLIGGNVRFDYDWGIGELYKRIGWDSSLVVTYPTLTDSAYSVQFRSGSFEKTTMQEYRYFQPSYVEDTTSTGFEVLKEEIIEGDIVIEETDVEAHEAEYDYEEDKDYEEDGYEDTGYGIGFTADSSIVFKEWDFDPEVVQIHTLPYLFSNAAAQSPEFLDHFNKVIGHREYDKIIFEHPSFNRSKTGESKSPLQFILASKSLKWAYYTLILGALLYVLFKGKRKQRIVPTLQPNNNTSLEYVQTLGSLYEHQDKPKKLVKHLEEIFHHKVKARYFLDVHDPAFTEKLSKKSNINITEINLIVKTFETITGRYEFNHSDLSTLYRRLDAFYKNCK